MTMFRPALLSSRVRLSLSFTVLFSTLILGFAIVTYSLSRINAAASQQLHQLLIALLVVILIALIAGGLAGSFLAQQVLRPIKQLAVTIDTISPSNLSPRVEATNTNAEVSSLALSFNSLLDRLEEAFRQQRRFMADASHQIRTPITVALAAAQVTSRESELAAAHCKDSLQVVEQQMIQLRRTVEDMFFLSQSDIGVLVIQRRPMYVDDAVSEAVFAAKALASTKHQLVKVEGLPEARCLGDQDLLKQAILILLENSVKFTPPGGLIEIILFRRGPCWVCSVTDNGVGITPEAKPHVFERFYRGTRLQNDGAPGSGLGLAIAKSIVESHHGSLALLESQPGRTTFEMAIPILEENYTAQGTSAGAS